MKAKIAASLIAFLLVIPVFTETSRAQKQAGGDIQALISKLNDTNEFDTQAASGPLIKMGHSVIPHLIKSIEKSNGCDFKLNAAQVIRKIVPKQEIVKSTLLDVARYRCEHSLTGTMADKHAFILNVHAASILAAEVDGGIPLTAELFTDEARFVRRNAAMAFLELAEILEKGRPDNTDVKPEMVRATIAVIPILVKALDDEDKFVQCRTYAALLKMQRSSYEELLTEVERALQGVADRCE